MKIFLIVLFSLLFIFILLLLLPVGVDISIEKGRFSLKIALGPLKFSPGGKGKNTEKSKAKGKKLSAEEICELIKPAASSLKRLLKAVYFSRFEINAVLGFPEDSMKTALSYGAVCGCVSAVMPVLEDCGLKKYDVSVDADFDNPGKLDAKINIRAMVIILLLIAIKAFCFYRKVTNERCSNE